jgi:hypothetical protein
MSTHFHGDQFIFDFLYLFNGSFGYLFNGNNTTGKDVLGCKEWTGLSFTNKDKVAV